MSAHSHSCIDRQTEPVDTTHLTAARPTCFQDKQGRFHNPADGQSYFATVSGPEACSIVFTIGPFRAAGATESPCPMADAPARSSCSDHQPPGSPPWPPAPQGVLGMPLQVDLSGDVLTKATAEAYGTMFNPV